MNIYRGSVYWCNIIRATGHVQKGYRPCVVISNDIGNAHAQIANVIPLTSQPRKPLPCHAEIFINGVKNTVLCEDIQTIDKNEVGELLAILTHEQMSEIEKALRAQLWI